jgi:hypothetical protein
MLGGIVAAVRGFGGTLKNPQREEKVGAGGFARPGPPPSPLSGDEQDLPASYGRSEVTLMVVDPYLVYAYWNVDVARLPEGTKSAALRFHEASEAAPRPSFDVDVDLRAPNWYVQLWSPAQSYYADLGVTTGEGAFVPLATSNRVQTPRAWPAAETQKTTLVGQAVSPADTGEAYKPVASAGSVELAPAVSAQIAGIASARVVPAVSPPTTEAQPSARLPESPTGPTEPPVRSYPPRPVYADEMLQQKLAQIYALRSWRDPPAVAMAAASAEALVGTSAWTAAPQSVAVERVRKNEVLALVPPAIPADLTALAERRFSPGLPSSPVSKEIPLPT